MIKDSVIIFVCDENYIDHVKSLSINCREQGNYKGDFAVICPFGSNVAKEFIPYGFYILERDNKSFFQKFYVFDEYFKKWRRALYLDADIIIQDDLEKLFKVLELDETKIWMDTEDGTTMSTFWRDPHPQHNRAIYNWMREKYPHVDNQTFNSAFILFNPYYIPDGVPQSLISIQNTIEAINKQTNGGTDQQILNLLLAPQSKKIPNKLVCYWGLAEENCDVPSVTRGWVGNEVPVAIHLSRWYAQWIKKTPDADAYRNRKLGVPNYDLYMTNLEKFKELPKSDRDKTLIELFDFYGSDKHSGHGYGDFYEMHLPEKINKFIEIGVWKGASIRAFKDYYKGNGEFHTINISFGGEVITIHQLSALGIIPHEGNQGDIEFLETIKDEFSVIIDDGSHHSDEQIISFKQLFLNNLESGGLYVIEDVYGHNEKFWRRGIVKTPEDTIMGVVNKYLKENSMVSQFFTQEESDVIISTLDWAKVYNDSIIFFKKK